MQFLKYTALRFALFFIVFVALAWGLGQNVWLAAAVAMVVAFCVAYLFFNKLRVQAAADLRSLLSGRRRRKGSVELDDESAEDRLQ
ncbi:DUF4229 domain-containing protein [Arthrobacter sp. KK5.5]|uniref:DUF4229 domain-containing protein n=1 Tax=Arthrobacter sp. KK5.5 TaxID=3373084 RepID=UPI003EE4FFDE